MICKNVYNRTDNEKTATEGFNTNQHKKHIRCVFIPDDH